MESTMPSVFLFDSFPSNIKKKKLSAILTKENYKEFEL